MLGPLVLKKQGTVAGRPRPGKTMPPEVRKEHGNKTTRDGRALPEEPAKRCLDASQGLSARGELRPHPRPQGRLSRIASAPAGGKTRPRRSRREREHRRAQPSLRRVGPRTRPGKSKLAGGTAPSRRQSRRGGCDPGRQTGERGQEEPESGRG